MLRSLSKMKMPEIKMMTRSLVKTTMRVMMKKRRKTNQQPLLKTRK